MIYPENIVLQTDTFKFELPLNEISNQSSLHNLEQESIKSVIVINSNILTCMKL